MSVVYKHKFGDVNFESVNDFKENIFYCRLNGLRVTGTNSKSRGEACMRFTIMLEEMQDQESKPIQSGDILICEHDGETVQAMVDDIGTYTIEVRYNLGGDNFRGPERASAVDQVSTTDLGGGPFGSRPKKKIYEWEGVMDVEFRAWRDVPCANGSFIYTRTVNVWRES